MEMLGEASGVSGNHMEHQSNLLDGEVQRSCKELLSVFLATEMGAPRIHKSRSYERFDYDVVRKKIRSEQRYYIPSNRDSAKNFLLIDKMTREEKKKKKKKKKMEMQRRTDVKGKSITGEEKTEDLVMADDCNTQGETDRGTEADTRSDISSIPETVRCLCTELEENVRLYMKTGPPSVDSDVKLVFDHVKNLFEFLRTFTLGQDLNKLDMKEEKQQEEINLEQMRNSTVTFHCHELQRTFERDPPVRLYVDFSEEEEDKEIDDEDDYRSAMEEEKKEFDEHLSNWEWESKLDPRWGDFGDTTVLSPMLLTHRTPGHYPPDEIAKSALEIFSIKVTKIKNAPWLKWPLQVYGMIAARDNADHNRNFIFYRERDDCQILTEEDCFLRLTGPFRAIVAGRHLCFEIQLKVKGETRSEDRVLIYKVHYHSCHYDHGIYTHVFRKHFCTMELSFRKVQHVIQATILGVRVVEGTPSPFKYGGRVSCYSPPQEVMVIDKDGTVMDITDTPSGQVVLLDSGGEEMPVDSDGYLDLLRHAVSVELIEKHVVSPEFQASLKVVILAYSPAYPNIAAQGHVYITPKRCGISQAVCDLGNSNVEITVAWSHPIKDVSKMMMVKCNYA